MSSEDIQSRMQRLSLLINYYIFIDLASSPSSTPELEITRIPAKKKQK